MENKNTHTHETEMQMIYIFDKICLQWWEQKKKREAKVYMNAFENKTQTHTCSFIFGTLGAQVWKRNQNQYTMKKWFFWP